MNNDNKTKKKTSLIKKISYAVLAGAAIVGMGYLAYKKVPAVKGLVGKVLPSKKETIETKPFRKYETYHKK